MIGIDETEVASMSAVLHFEASEAEKLATGEIMSEQHRG
jgi:hypothetical protein